MVADFKEQEKNSLAKKSSENEKRVNKYKRFAEWINKIWDIIQFLKRTF